MIRSDTEYPFILINAFSEDVRTPLWNVAKFVKRFREITKQMNISHYKRLISENQKLFLNVKPGHHSGNSTSEKYNHSACFNLLFHEYCIEHSKAIEVKDGYSL